MASEVAASLPPASETSPAAPAQTELTNGDHAAVATGEVLAADASATKTDTSLTEPTPASVEAVIDVKSSQTVPESEAGPTPVTEISNGIEGIAGFIPKDAPIHSHPTPPPDMPLAASEAEVDTVMEDSIHEVSVQPQQVSEIVSAPPVESTESTLVRPREDDEEDEERVAKRSRMDVDHESLPVESPTEAIPATTDSVMTGGDTDAIAAVQDGPHEPAVSVTEAKLQLNAEPGSDATIQTSALDVAAEDSKPQTQASDAPSQESKQVHETNGVSEQAAVIDAKPSVEQPLSNPTLPQTVAKGSDYSTEPITSAQKAFILGTTIKNLKKTKHALGFLVPVDPVALNIPQYPEIVKNPMDISTLEEKLKTDKYNSVQEFFNDFSLIIANCKTFNGPAHPISHAADSMEAYVRKSLEKLPSSSQVALPRMPKKASPAVKTPAPRRESRVPTAPLSAGAPSTSTPFALQADGMPQIRREPSMNSRPARAIKPPQNRELTYAKPKRKEHMLELRFCEHVLDQLRSPRYTNINQIFLAPVDPVALNIPHYRNIIKSPMDLSTMAQKLKQGQYAKANEFIKDFNLMIDNCLLFNAAPNPVRDLAIEMRRQFGSLWEKKEKWEKANRPASHRAVSQSGDEESADEDAEDEEEGEDDKNAQILALQKQLAEMQNMIQGIAGSVKTSKGKKQKSKSNGGSSKKMGNMSATPKFKAAPTKAKKPAKVKLVTYDEKQEISEAVGRMNEPQVTKLTQIITENCIRYRNMDEMELEIDDLPNDVQTMLLKYVREIFGNPKKAARAVSPDDLAAEDDDDFAPSRKRDDPKRKKHKPMGKREQTDTIKNLQSKLAQFTGGGNSDSGSPTSYQNAQADTSGDEESEESEEE